MATLLQVLMIGPVVGRAGRKSIRLLAVRLGVQHLDPLVELIRAGKITTVIGRRFPLSEVPRRCAISAKGTPKARSSSPSGSFRRGRIRTQRRSSCAFTARLAELALQYATAVQSALADPPFGAATDSMPVKPKAAPDLGLLRAQAWLVSSATTLLTVAARAAIWRSSCDGRVITSC